MPKAIRRSRGRQVKPLPSAAVRVTIPAALAPGPAGLNIDGLRRSTNVDERGSNDNPLERRVNIETRPRRGPVPGRRTGTAVGQRSQTR